MILFIKCYDENGNNILINWKKIITATQNGKDTILKLDNNDTFTVKCEFETFRKILLEHELTLDENSRITTYDRETGGWLMID